MVIVFVIVAGILEVCWDNIYYKWFYKEEVTTEYSSPNTDQENDTITSSYEPQGLPACVCPAPEKKEVVKSSSTTKRHHSSRSYYYDDDDEYDEDGMYKDEDEDIKDKRQYDDYDDDEADDWE